MTVGEKIRQYRLIKGLTQKELGRLSETAETTVRQYEGGKRTPRIDQIEKIAAALGVTPTDLMGWNKDTFSTDSINQRVKELRLNLGLSQDDFGNAIGLSKSGISNIENGTRSVRETHIKLICSAFDVDETWLRSGEGEANAVRNITLSQFSIDELLDEIRRRCNHG